MVTLLLCDDADPSAGWAASGLRARGFDVRPVTGTELECALQCHHTLGDDRTGIDLVLPGRRHWNEGQVDGLLNRLQYLPAPVTPGVGLSDRAYAREEFNAMTLSWLTGLASTGCPVIGLPHPAGLGGEWRYRSEWLLLAHAAGLPAAPLQLDSEKPDEPPAPAVYPAVAVCGAEAGSRSPEHHDGVLRLASILGCDLLTVWFDGRDHVVGGDLFPDLRRAGPAGLDALASRLRQHATAGRAA